MKKKAFTLIELMVVIAIIGILATMIVINIVGAQKKARVNSALSNMNEALKVASACVVNEGKVSTYGAGSLICDDNTVNAKWPTFPNGYVATITVSSAGVITAVGLTSSSADSTTYACTTTSCSL